VTAGAATRSPDVLIVGGGVIGLAIGWQATLRGLSVTVVDPEPGSGASHHAAGMLAPVTEVHYGEEDLLRLNLAAAARYPSFVGELEAAAAGSAGSVGYRTTGTLAAAFDADDKALLDDLHRYQLELGLSSIPLSSREARALEPFLAPGVRGGLLVEGDHQVDNRALVAALLVACERAGVVFDRRPAHAVDVRHDRVLGVDGRPAGQLVLAAGCRTRELEGLPPAAVPPVRPVKGQILRLRDDPAHPILGRTVRAFVRGRPVYLVPRESGEIVVGATTEELGLDTRTTVGGVLELLDDARHLLPGITELELVEAAAGLRPGSPDNAPMIGRGVLEGLIVATGHYRNGVLLAPVTADAIAELLTTGELPPGFGRFDPARFAGQPTRAVATAPVPA
jgi:glycine oxidase